MNPHSRVVDMAEWDARLDRVIEQRALASFMSNSKWRRLFAALALPDLRPYQGIWKFVDSDTTHRFPLPDGEDLSKLDGQFYEPGGKSPFKRIEWVEIAREAIPHQWKNVPFMHEQQDIDAAVSRVEAVGKFATEMTDTGLRIYGYRTNPVT